MVICQGTTVSFDLQMNQRPVQRLSSQSTVTSALLLWSFQHLRSRSALFEAVRRLLLIGLRQQIGHKGFGPRVGRRQPGVVVGIDHQESLDQRVAIARQEGLKLQFGAQDMRLNDLDHQFARQWIEMQTTVQGVAKTADSYEKPVSLVEVIRAGAAAPGKGGGDGEVELKCTG